MTQHAETQYTGHVDANTTSEVRLTSALEITKASVGPMDNNAYLLRCTATGAGLLIDAANEPDRLVALAEERLGDGTVGSVITTHQHPDHWQGLKKFVKATGATAFAHPLDADDLPVDTEPLQHEDTISVGDVELSVIHLRGHTPGSIALHWRDPEGTGHLFTGDSLFPGGPGKTWSKADFESLVTDLEDRIFAVLPDDTVIYPGHGDDSSIGTERPSVPEWRSRGW